MSSGRGARIMWGVESRVQPGRGNDPLRPKVILDMTYRTLPVLSLCAIAALSLSACSDDTQTPEDDPQPGTFVRETEGVASAAPTSTVAPDKGSDVADGAQTRSLSRVPVRFRGTFAPDRRACAQDYEYQPTFQNVDVTADRVMFFENGGPVREVEVEGDNIAIGYLDTYADGSVPGTIYLRLDGDGSVRYRSSSSEPIRTFVACP